MHHYFVAYLPLMHLVLTIDRTDNEKKVLRATATAQTETGAPVIIHPGRHPIAPAEAIRILQEAGGDVSKTVMSHLDSK
jgi:phosphotriesterase-related protein